MRIISWVLLTAGSACLALVAGEGLWRAIREEREREEEDLEEVREKEQEYREGRELRCTSCGEAMERKLDVDDLMLHWCPSCGTCRLVAPDLEELQAWWVPESGNAAIFKNRREGAAPAHEGIFRYPEAKSS